MVGPGPTRVGDIHGRMSGAGAWAGLRLGKGPNRKWPPLPHRGSNEACCNSPRRSCPSSAAMGHTFTGLLASLRGSISVFTRVVVEHVGVGYHAWSRARTSARSASSRCSTTTSGSGRSSSSTPRTMSVTRDCPRDSPRTARPSEPGRPAGAAGRRRSRRANRDHFDVILRHAPAEQRCVLASNVARKAKDRGADEQLTPLGSRSTASLWWS
jgi:hypothetical protein